MTRDDKFVLRSILIGLICFAFMLYFISRSNKRNNVIDCIEIVTTSGDTVLISGGEYTEIKLKP